MNDDYYKILGIESGADFKAIKKAYYRRVKDCHPDLYGGDRQKEEEFKILANAFDVISDPDKRNKYDEKIGIGAPQPDITGEHYVYDGISVMDTDYDDTLEELIVGNLNLAKINLATLLLDLQRTEVFMTFREGKNYFKQQRYRAALHFFKTALEHSPENILYHYYIARTYYYLHEYYSARRHYQAGIKLGSRRVPPQRLIRFQRELDELNNEQFSWSERLLSIFRRKPEGDPFLSTSEEMVDETNRTIARLIRERKRQKALDAQKNRKQLPG